MAGQDLRVKILNSTHTQTSSSFFSIHFLKDVFMFFLRFLSKPHIAYSFKLN